MANNCLNWKSKEVEELAKQVGVVNTPAFADKIGTWLDKNPIVVNQQYEGDVTPSENTIFVFGSNPEGRHGAGAAKVARNKFGAIYGQGEGLQGSSYALPTKDLRIKENSGFRSISIDDITSNISKMYEVAKQNPTKEFKVAFRNTDEKSLNGYTGLEMIEMFNNAGKIPSNIIFSKEWNDTGLLNLSTEQQLPTAEQVKEYLETSKPKSIEKGKVVNPQGLAYAECRLPALWKELFDDLFWIGENNDIDFNKVNEHLPDLLKAFGYRIPNEDKYSSLPLKVTGFLPTGSGGAIMLPAEITTISGSDYDVDKMYVIIKKLAKSKGKLQVEQYLDESNSTKEQRKLLYANRTDKGRKIKSEYNEKIKDANDKIKELKKLSIEDIGYQLDLLDEELAIANNPTPEDIVIYKIYGKDITKPEFKESVEKEIYELYKQLDVLNKNTSGEVEIESVKEVVELRNKRDELIKERDLKVLETVSDEEFDKLSIARQNTKGARGNEKLDTFIGIYSNPHTAMDIMTPGGYESIRKISDKINKNKSIPKDIFGAETMDALTIQNIQGRDLKGIAANHNSHASKRQWSNLKLNFPIMFDGRTNGADMLNSKVANSVSGKPVNITRNFAEILAASVDNGKDPLLASINYNQHTADVISLMLATGADINTVFAFINQPVILKTIEMISLGEERDLLSALKTIAKSMSVETKVDKITVTNFNQDKLFEMIGGDSTSVTQCQVLANMIKYTVASKDFSDLIAASKADTKGIGKFMEEGITLMRNVKKALTLKNIQNTEEFLKGNNEEVAVDNTPVKDGVEDLFKQNSELSKIGDKQQYSNYLNSIFPSSKVKDILYHGTTSGKFDEFSKEKLGVNTEAPSAMLGFFFSSSKGNAGAYSIANDKDWATKSTDEIIESNEIKKLDNELYSKLIKESGYTDKRDPSGNGDVIVNSTGEIINFDNFEFANGISEFTDKHKEFLDISKDIEDKVNKINSDNSNEQLYMVVLNTESPNILDKKGESGNIAHLIRGSKNNDSVILKNYKDPFISDVYVVFEPEQIHILGSKQDIDGFKQFVKENKSTEKSIDQRFNNMFAKYGVELPLDNIMSKLYPFLNESFSTIKDVIEQDLGYSISADDARLVDQMLVQYYSSKFEWYSKDNKFNIVKNLPGDINFLKATYPEFVKSDEIKPLFDALVSGTDNRLGMDIIEFDNSQTSSDEQRTDIKKSWKALSNHNSELVLTNELLKSNLLTNEELSLLEVTDDYRSFNNLNAIMQFADKFKGTSAEKLVQDYLFDKLANDLIKYSFYTTGLNFTPKSISSLVPIDLYSTISYNGTLMPDMIYGIQNMQNPGVNKSFDESGKEISNVIGGTDASIFLDQFYKHMADNRKFVPRAEFKDGGGKDNTITLVDDNKIIIIPEITENDKLWTKDKDGYLTATSRYISYKVDGKVSLYENEPSGDNGMLFFRRINTLGAQGLLYEFDSNGGESSIVPGNNIDSSIKTMKVPTKEEIMERKEACK